MSFKRLALLNRTRFLISQPNADFHEEVDLNLNNISPTTEETKLKKLKSSDTLLINYISRLLKQANCPYHPLLIIILITCSGAALTWGSSYILSVYFIPLASIVGGSFPLVWLKRRGHLRAMEFAADYPSILLAMSSSIKAGLTVYQALERSVRLLPENNITRMEIEKLLLALRSNIPREKAIHEFAYDINLPDLELFRSALLIVLESGGRFAPTLQRLAQVSNARNILIRSSYVTTANMRMTSNILLAITPLLLTIISMRMENFWFLLIENSTANLFASAGGLLIIGCYFTLRKMSNFKP